MKIFRLTAALSAILLPFVPNVVMGQAITPAAPANSGFAQPNTGFNQGIQNGTQGINQGINQGVQNGTQGFNQGINNQGVNQGIQNGTQGANPAAGQAPGVIQVPGIGPVVPAATVTPPGAPPTVIVIQNIPPTQAAPNQRSVASPAPRQGTLDTALLQATCAQDWGQAIQIVNRAITAAPVTQRAYRTQLQLYRSRLQNLQSNQVQVPGWRQQCGA